MLRRIGLFVTLLLLVSAAGPPAVAASTTTCSFPVTETDATGEAVTVDAPPERVVVLGPSAAQTMWEIDGEGQVVGMPVDQYTSYLPGHDERVDIMNQDRFTVNVERVVELEPDLVIAPNVIPDGTVTSLRDAGVSVYKFPFAADIEDVVAKTELTGRLTDNCGGADDRVTWMTARLEVVRTAVEDEPRPSVVYPLGGGFVAGEGTFLHEIIQAGGGQNVAAEAGIAGYARISVELVVTSNPAWIILNDGLPMSAIQLHAYNHTEAIEQDQVIRMNPNYANQPAPRVVLAVETVAKALHPEAYAAANGTATATPSSPETSTVARETSTETPIPSAGQPGFGVVVAVIGIIAAVAVARTRRS